MEHKKCNYCGELLPFDEFARYYSKTRKKYRLKSKCRYCWNKYQREYRRKMKDENPTKYYRIQRESNLSKNYGITHEYYNQMFKKQGGKCKICGGKPNGQGKKNGRLAVDHCHDTGKVRSLLCNNCNTGIGLFKHDQELLKKAIKYLIV